MAIENKPSTKKKPKPRERKPKSAKVSKYPKRSLELPKNTMLLKTPLPREPLPPRHSSLPKIVYISTRTPFISAIKRIRRHLSTFDKQSRSTIIASKSSFSSTSTQFHNRKNNNNNYNNNYNNQRKSNPKQQNTKKKDKYVIVRATGRAIEKAMGVGLYLQSQDDIVINLRTGTVEATDAVVVDNRRKGLQDLLKPDEVEKLERRLEMLGSKQEEKEGSKEKEDTMDVDSDDNEEDHEEEKEQEEDGMDVDEEEEDDWTEVEDDYPSRKRYTSMLEIIVRRKELPSS